MDYKPSSAKIIKSVPKTDTNVFGILDVATIDTNTPAIVVFGGELTTVPRHANHYIKQMKQILEQGNISGVNIYSVYYDFGSRNTDSERIQIFKSAGHRIRNLSRNTQEVDKQIAHMQATEKEPVYLKQLIDMIVLPILAPIGDQERPDVKTVAQRASNIRFYAHSHGAAVVTMLGKHMHAIMKRMGYSPNEIRQVQKNIIVIQHGPITPLEKPRFTTLSFASASDTKMNLHNSFSDYVAENSFDVYPSYFSQGGANLFIAGEISEKIGKEHDNDGLVFTDNLTDDGKIILAAERNAIINAMRFAGQPTPHIRELVSGDGIDFDALESNGNFFYKMMLNDIKSQQKQTPKHDHQK